MQLHPFSSSHAGQALSYGPPNREAVETRRLPAIAVRNSENSVEVDQDGSFFTGFDSPSA